MMEEVLFDKWVAALRSGEYKQGRHKLKTEEGKYCCLGVLCVVGDKTENLLARSFPQSAWFPILITSYDGGPDILGPTTIQGYLSELNDTRNWTFEQIADWLVENKALFVAVPA